MSDQQFDPNNPQVPPNGSRPNVQKQLGEFAVLIETILAKYSGGFANPVPVKVLDDDGDEVEVLISPLQAIVNMTQASYDLVDHMKKLRVQLKDMSVEEEEEEEDDRPRRRRR
jgi:uncharacterized protein YdcH (DUF465 family)